MSPLPIIAAGCALVLLAGPSLAAEPVKGGTASSSRPGMTDQTVVLARTVHPRIAYRGPAPDENPARVVVTLFPGQAMSESLGGFSAFALGDGELADNAPMAPLYRLTGPGGALMGLGTTASGGPGGAGGGAAPLGGTAHAVGGSVMKATGGLGSSISQAVLGATGAGGRR